MVGEEEGYIEIIDTYDKERVICFQLRIAANINDIIQLKKSKNYCVATE